MTLPAWDFATDSDRHAFIAWANAELDRLDVLVTERFDYRSDNGASFSDLQSSVIDSQALGRPVETDAHRERRGQNAELRDVAILRWVFDRYWPARRRSMADTANVYQIVAARHRRALSAGDRTPDRRQAVAERANRSAHALKRAYDRTTDTPGRRIAADDLAFLDTLPAHLFADHFTGDKISG